MSVDDLIEELQAFRNGKAQVVFRDPSRNTQIAAVYPARDSKGNEVVELRGKTRPPRRENVLT